MQDHARTWWLKATATYSQSERPDVGRQGVGGALLLGAALGEGPAMMPLQLLVAPRLVALALPSLPLSSCDFVPWVSVKSPSPVSYKVNAGLFPLEILN